MAARAIGSGTISFGLVSIPVKLYSTGEPAASVTFNWLHKKCGSRVKQQYFCPTDEEKVERDDLIKGYEFSKGQYVRFTPDELKALEEKSTQAIEITEFVPEAEVDPLYLDKSYYLGPDKGGDRAYKLLSRVLEETGRVAVAKYAARGKQYLVMMRPHQGGLLMQQLRYPDEVKAFSEVPVGDADVKDAELALAMQLVEQAASESFRPENYEDEVRKRVQELIQQKIEGQEISAAPQEAPKAQIIDLMEALKASLADAPAGSGRAQSGGSGRKTAKRATRPKAKKKASS